MFSMEVTYQRTAVQSRFLGFSGFSWFRAFPVHKGSGSLSPQGSRFVLVVRDFLAMGPVFLTTELHQHKHLKVNYLLLQKRRK